ncbi:MAG: hypothetical protein ACOXZK_11505 [Bacteroidales bacterium]|jgi:hypothetical protein|nr:hypothetical protein [Bacteroidales bacterium]
MRLSSEKKCEVSNNITIMNSNVNIGCCSSDFNNMDLENDYYPYNNKNPYDFEGATHNFLLKECEIYLDKNPCEKEDDLNCNVGKIVCFLKNSGYIVDEFSIYEMVKTVLEDADNYCLNVIKNSKLSDESKKILSDVINELIVLSENEISDYSIYKRAILLYEDKTINSTNTNEIDQILLLTSFSIMRYSLYYHFEKYETQNTLKSVSLKGWVKGLIVGVCDVAGGVIGGLGGSVAGPAGTVTGAATGATAASTCADKILNQK